MIDNVVPLIPGEEEKIESELGKILASEIPVSAHCHRVPVIDGHMESVSVRLAKPLSVADAAEILEGWKGSAVGDSLPSAPATPLVMAEHPDRPQTRLDRDAGGGMSVTIGRLRSCPVFDLRFTLLSHNLVRGAAGAAVLNAELMFARGLIVSGAHS
jgi:aspartate-semialdehyde dehydrogenase